MSVPQSLGEGFDQEVRPMLDLIDDLHGLVKGHETQVALPRIAVVGAQSSGKSSVLERLSGIELPRAQGLCTRVPLMLSMKSAPAGTDPSVQISYEGNEQSPKTCYLQDVAREISKATESLAGNRQGIVDKSIKLRIEATGLPDLTLVDLPGIAYSPVGNQPKNIKEQVRSLILKHIQPKETLILCVFAGDVDLQASEALELARIVDPHGDRTLGVITKLDLVQDKSTLKNKILQIGSENMGIKLGFTAVRNRTNDELKKRTSAKDCITKERQLVRNMQEMSEVPQQYTGIPALVEKLCSLQLALLKRVLPGIGKRFIAEVEDCERRLAVLQNCLTSSQSFLVQQRAVEQLKLGLQCMVNGNYAALESLSGDVEGLCPVVDALLQRFTLELKNKAPVVFSRKRVREAQTALDKNAGHALPNFVSNSVFETLIRKWHAPYADVMRASYRGIAEEVERVLVDLTGKVMPQRLRSFFVSKVRRSLKCQQDLASAQMELILKMEYRVIYTVNNYYVTTLRALQGIAKDDNTAEAQSSPTSSFRSQVLQLLSDGDAESFDEEIISKIENCSKSHDPEDHRLLELQLSAICYDKVVRKRLGDDLMRIVHYFFIQHAAQDLGLRLSEDLTPDQAHGLLKPSVAQAEEHARLTAKLAAFRDGINRIEEAGCMEADMDSSADRRRLSKEDIEIDIVLKLLHGVPTGREAVKRRVHDFFESLGMENCQDYSDTILEKVFQAESLPKYQDAFEVRSLKRSWGKPQMVAPKVTSFIEGMHLYVKSVDAKAVIECSLHCNRRYRLCYEDSSSYEVTRADLLDMV